VLAPGGSCTWQLYGLFGHEFQDSSISDEAAVSRTISQCSSVLQDVAVSMWVFYIHITRRHDDVEHAYHMGARNFAATLQSATAPGGHMGARNFAATLQVAAAPGGHHYSLCNMCSPDMLCDCNTGHEYTLTLDSVLGPSWRPSKGLKARSSANFAEGLYLMVCPAAAARAWLEV
jgi:hypothetical protein